MCCEIEGVHAHGIHSTSKFGSNFETWVPRINDVSTIPVIMSNNTNIQLYVFITKVHWNWSEYIIFFSKKYLFYKVPFKLN